MTFSALYSLFTTQEVQIKRLIRDRHAKTSEKAEITLAGSGEKLGSHRGAAAAGRAMSRLARGGGGGGGRRHARTSYNRK